MNPEPTPTPREQIEMRLTALLMGELSAEETVALHALIAADPELAKLHARLRQAMELLREATAEPEPATPTPARLSGERRERLLAHFKAPAPRPARRAPIAKAPRRDWSWVLPLGVAASVVFLLAGLALPVLSVSGKLSASRKAYDDAPPDFSATSESTVEGREDDEMSGRQKISGGGKEALAPAEKSQATALYLPPTDDAPASGEPASSLRSWGGTVDSSGVGGGSGNPATAGNRSGSAAISSGAFDALINDSKRLETRDRTHLSAGPISAAASQPIPPSTATPPLPAEPVVPMLGDIPLIAKLFTSTAQSSASPLGEKNDGRAAQDREVGEGIVKSGAGTINLSGTNTYNGGTVVGGGTLELKGLVEAKPGASIGGVKGDLGRGDTDGDDGKKSKRAAPFPVTPTTPTTFDSQLLGDSLELDPARPVTEFEGFINYGSPVQKKLAEPAAPARPADASPIVTTRSGGRAQIEIEREFRYRGEFEPPQKQETQTGKDSGILRGQTGPPASDDKPREIAAKGVEIRQNNLEELSFGWLDDKTSKVKLNTATEGTDWDEADKRRPADKEKGEKVNLPKVPQAPQATVPPVRQELAKLEQPEADPFGEPDAQRSAQPVPEPAPPAAKPSPPPPPSSVPMPVETAPEQQKEVALQRREGEELYKTIDEAKKLDGNGRVGKGTQAEEKLPPAKKKPASARGPVQVFGGGEGQTAEGDGLEELQVEVNKQRALVSAARSEAANLRTQAGINDPDPEKEAALLSARRDAPSNETPGKAPNDEKTKMQEYTETKHRYLQEKRNLETAEVNLKAERMKSDGEKLDEEKTPADRPAQPAAIPQPEVATSANAFSTFSLNVSDVSFKLAGASLEKGRMPELATVRSEEFINAFDYRDPEPAAGAPLAFATERARYPFAQNRDLVRFSVKTAAAGRQPGRPLNLVLLLDNSGSMERADRVRILREALRVLAAQLQPQDRLSVVTFARTPRLWADGVAGDKAAEAVARVGEITPQGGTNLESALDLGYATALKHYQPGSISRVVLLTDGAANLGDVNPDALKRKVETNRQRGVALDCFGIGWEGYDDTLLETLARNGDGRYGFINTPEEAAGGFAAQLAGALRVAASDVKVQVEWNPRRVTAYRQIGYAKHQLKKEQFRDNTVDAAEIGAAESGNALYAVEVNPRGEGDLATVRVRFKVPGTADYKEHEWAVPFTNSAPPLEQASPALRLAGTASAFSEWLVASPYAAEVTTDRLLGLLNGVPAIYPADPRPKKLEWMIRTAKSVSGR